MIHCVDQVFPTITEVNLRLSLLLNEGPAGHNILTRYRGLKIQYLDIVVMAVGLILLL